MQHLGKYEILSELGRGGLGVVYKARDPLINRLVALKTITSNWVGNTALRDRFFQEARLAGTLEHPNIVTIYEFGEESGAPFIAMEFIEGETLERFIGRRADVPLVVKLGYTLRISEGIQYAHEHGVIHRDIKPGNIMVTAEGAAKIVDFGIVRILDLSMTQGNTGVGTPSYMAPQLYQGEGPDARSDIWALGATLYKLLAYQEPFTAESQADLMFKILHEDPPPLRTLCPECPEALEKIVNKMLEKQATARYQSVAEVLRDLGAVWRQEQQETVQKLLAESQQLIEARDFRGAQDHLRKALQIDISSVPAKRLLDQATRETRRLENLPRVEERVNRGRDYLRAGRLADARAEVESALGMDPSNDAAQGLRKDIEGATKSAEQLAQLLRVAKQRLAEGALTEVQGMLAEASRLGAEDPRVRDLRNQVAEEEGRRQRRRKLSEVQDRARGLWMELKYEECLAVLEDGLNQFPGEEALLKLQETARQDWEEEHKQNRLVQARKLLGQQQFAQARSILEELAIRHPQDSGVNKLRGLVEQGEEELRKQERLARELAELRGLVRQEKFAEAVARGEALLREYPEDFELKELVGYARAESAQGRDKQASQLLQAAKEEQEEKYRRGEQGRLDAAQTFVERGKFEEATRILNEAFATQILQPSDPRARQLLDQIEKTSILSHSSPKQPAAANPPVTAQPRGVSPSVPPADSSMFSATNVFSQMPPVAPPVPAAPVMPPSEASRSSTPAASSPVRKSSVPATQPRPQSRQVQRVAPGAKPDVSQTAESVKGHMVSAGGLVERQIAGATRALGSLLASAGRIPRRSLIVVGVVAVVLIAGAAIGVPAWRNYRSSHLQSVTESNLRADAERLWDQHEPDQSEDKWKQIQALNGALASKAAQQIAFIEAKRTEEQGRFDEGSRLLQADKSNPQARQILQEVVDLHLWHAAEAQNQLNDIDQSLQTVHNLTQQEQQLFQEGEQLFGNGNYEAARRRFRDLLNLKVPNSTLQPKAQEYLNKIRALNDDKKNYDAAMEDLKNENLDAAGEGFRAIVARKGTFKDEAGKQLEKIASAQNSIGAISELIRSHSYRAARGKLDGLKEWPKSSDRLRLALTSAEQQELDSIKSRAQSLLQKQDTGGLEHLQDELNLFSSRAEDATVLRAATELGQSLNQQIPQLKKEQSSDNQAFSKAEKDFQEARNAGDFNRLSTDVLHEFEQIARGNSYNHTAAESYVTKVIPDIVREYTQNLSAKGKAVVPPISCDRDTGPTLGQTIPCAKLDPGSPLRWIGIPTIDVPPGAKQAGKLPYTLRLLVVVDGSGKVTRVEKDGTADQDFLKKAKDAAKKWRSTTPLQNGKPVNASFSIDVTFQP